jgi:hypothetical protein
MTTRIKLNCKTGEKTVVNLTDAELKELNSLLPTESDKADKAKANKRFDRNQLLAETDWMASQDVTMPDAWKTYRQALRDLPAADGFPDVDMPTKPS